MTASRRYILPCLLVLLLAGVLGSGKAHAFMPAKGMFLVANEQLADPRFRDRVILLIEHDPQGSAGLVVNRPSRLLLATILQKGSRLAGQGRAEDAPC